MSHKKNVWFIDDSEDPENILYTAEAWLRLLPDYSVRHFGSPIDVIDALIHDSRDEHPQIMVFDAKTEKRIYLGGAETTPSNYGGSDYYMYIALAMKSEGITFPESIIFSSADPRYAEGCKQHAASLNIIPSDQIIACDKWSITHAANLRNKKYDFNEEYVDFDLYKHLNKLTNSKLPTSLYDIDKYRIQNHMLEPKDIVSFFGAKKLNAFQALSLFHDDAWVEHKNELHEYSSSWEQVQMYYQSDRIEFQEGTGTACHGHAVFNIDQIASSLQNGKNPVLITKHFNADQYPLLSKLSGLIILNGKDTAHTKFIAEAHKVPILIAPESPDAVLTEESFRSGDTVIQKGDLITLDCQMERLFKGHLPIEPRETHGYVHEVSKIHNELAEIYNFNTIEFKANIDHPSQIKDAFRFNADGIGLVRTEHLALIDPIQTRALRQIFLGNETKEAIEVFHVNHQNQLLELFTAIHKEIPYCDPIDKFPVRVRLMDAPPEEFMCGTDLKKLNALIKKDDQRGVQLGLRRPTFYKSQIKAIFGAYTLSLTEIDEDAFPEKLKLELMIPMIKSSEELEEAMAMIKDGAKEAGVPDANYRVGMMGETIVAMENIAIFAKKVPFISIGSNDLSYSILNLPRFGDTTNQIAIVEDGARHPSVTLFKEVADFIIKSAEKARIANPEIEVDLCGAHAADLTSLKKIRSANLSSVSLIPTGRNLHALRADWALSDWSLRRDTLSNN